MRNYTKNLITENGLMLGLAFAPAYAHGRGTAGNTMRTAMAKAMGKTKIARRARNVALFFAAPFIGLAYLLAFPVVGFALLAWIAAKAVMNNEKTRPVAIVIAAPFLGLAFVTLGPIVGLGALTWYGGKALLRA